MGRQKLKDTLVCSTGRIRYSVLRRYSTMIYVRKYMFSTESMEYSFADSLPAGSGV